MKAAGRELVTPFDAFWEHFRAELPVPVEYIEEGHSAIFGNQGLDRVNSGLPAWTSLPDDDLAYHVAHEVAHIVLRQRAYPRTGRGRQYGQDSAEARVGRDMEEMVLHPAVAKLILPFGFRWEFIQGQMVDGAVRGLARSPAPEKGSPWSYTWALRYCELQLELPADNWSRLKTAYEARSPAVCRLGEELVAIMHEVGWGTREQALEAMVKVRDALGLGIDSRVLVVDPVGQRVL